MADLARHLGDIHEWARVAATEGRGNHRPASGPAGLPALPGWYGDRGRALVTSLESLDPGACWTFAPPAVTGFWRRRQLLETVVHRWDLQHATGMDLCVDVAVAADGVDEVVGTLYPRQVARGRTTWPTGAVRLVATDTGGTALLGTGAPVGPVAATAERLLLLLWRRVAVDDQGFAVDGDTAAVTAALDRRLTP